MRLFPRLLALQLLLLVILLACCDLTTSSSRSRSRKKSKMINLCHIKDQKAPMNCNCPFHNITEVDCWVVKPLARDDLFWGHFASQHIEKLVLKQHENGILNYIPTHLLHQLKNVHIFELLYVQMFDLAGYTFSNLTGLSELRVTDSKIMKLLPYSFFNMRNLTILDLGRNNITEITSDTFMDLPHLRILYLDRNLISMLRDKALMYLNSLQKLVLNRNKIYTINSDTFVGLYNLQHLDLRNNDLTIINPSTFTHTTNLQVLELDDNHIQNILVNAFENLLNLRKLYLSGNRLMYLDPDIFMKLNNVHFLDLRRNHLHILTFDNIKPMVINFYKSNSSLYLGGNKLSCNCNLAWIWGLRNETNNVHLKSLLEKLTCRYKINNGTEKIYDEDQERNLALERNQPQEMAQNLEENSGDNSKYSDGEEDNNRDEEDRENYEEVEVDVSTPHLNNKPKIECDNGTCYYIKRLFDLKTEELPCPKFSHKDLMASVQPPSHHEKARAGLSGSIWFSSSAQAVRSVLAASLLPLLFALFT